MPDHTDLAARLAEMESTGPYTEFSQFYDAMVRTHPDITRFRASETVWLAVFDRVKPLLADAWRELERLKADIQGACDAVGGVPQGMGASYAAGRLQGERDAVRRERDWLVKHLVKEWPGGGWVVYYPPPATDRPQLEAK